MKGHESNIMLPLVAIFPNSPGRMEMARIEVQETGHVDRNDSAFPTLVSLDSGDIICGFSVGGGPFVTGGTHCARSSDGGLS